MADQETRIIVRAETGAAQDALGRLADEAAGLAKASEKAGSEQQKLARQIADTTSKTEAARQAVERAKRAESEATQITRAFGSESREAAEAQQRLQQAEAAATKATREAEKAIADAATAVSNLAKTTDEKGAAAVRRMNDQLQRVGRDADKAASDLRGLEARVAAVGQVEEGLAQKISAARVAQEASTAAADRASRALREQEVATKKFGKGSDEATRALARLEEAEKDARAEAAKADRALDEASRALDKVGREGKVSAQSMQRLNKDLLSVAQAADKAGTQLRALDGRVKASSGSVSELGDFLKNVGTMMGVSLFAGGAMGMATALREMSAETMAYETAIANLPFGLEAARKATQGLVNDQQLAQSAAQGLALGVVTTETEFARLADAATKLGIKLGIGPSQALDNMMTALGRGSTEILDNLGVALKASEAYDRYAQSVGKSADELTDAEKKVAFKSEAIKALTAAADGTTLKLDSAAASIQRFGVQADNTGMAVKGAAVEIAGSMIDAIPVTGKFYSDLAAKGEQTRAHNTALELGAAAIKAQTEAQQNYLKGLGLEGDILSNLNQLTDDQRAKLEAVGQRAAENAATYGTLDGELLQHWETVKGFTSSLFEEADAYTQVTQRAREHAAAQKVIEDERWNRLEKRNRKLEEQAIEEEFIKANEMGPALPPGFKRHEKKAKKPKDLRMARHEFNTEVEDFAFETTKGVQEEARAASIALIEEESKAREAQIALLADEAQAFERAAEARAEEVDLIFFTLDVKNEAAERAAQLREEEMLAEESHARWLKKNAITSEQREKAETKILEIENKKRLAAQQKTLDEEARQQAKRQKIMEGVTGAVTTLGEGMVEAFEAMAKGEEGAVAKMLSDVLKGVAKKHAVLSLAEFALAAGSAASYNFPAAAAHAAAGGMHAGVAVAAGVGAIAAGKVWEARRGNPEEDKWAEQQATKERKEAWKEENGFGKKGGSSSGGSSGGGASGSDPGARGEDGLEAQEVPISHEQLRRQDATVRRRSDVGGPTVNINGPVHLYGAGGKREFIEDIRREIERSDRGGKRARI